MILRIENKTLDVRYLKKALEKDFHSFKVKTLSDVKVLSNKVKEGVGLKNIGCLLDNSQDVLNSMASFIYSKSMRTLKTK